MKFYFSLIVFFSFIVFTGCAGEREVKLLENPVPEFIGACSWSYELHCWACLYKYEARDALICSRRTGE